MEGHGAHVASTIGEDTNNSVAEARNRLPRETHACKGVRRLLGSAIPPPRNRVLGNVPTDVGGCPTSEIAEGIRYAADNGAKAIDLSLGGPEPSLGLHDALKYAIGKGAFVDRDGQRVQRG